MKKREFLKNELSNSYTKEQLIEKLLDYESTLDDIAIKLLDGGKLVQYMIHADKKISAIKYYRKWQGMCDLRDAKLAIDELWEQLR